MRQRRIVSLRAHVRWLAVGWRAVYDACRADYPCEVCEQYRLQAAINATRWAWGALW